MDSRYEKEIPKDLLILQIELIDQQESLNHLRKQIKESSNLNQKIQKALKLLNETPSLSDALFVLSLQLDNEELKKRCSEKIKILKRRKENHINDLLP